MMQYLEACRNNFLGAIGVSTRKDANLSQELERLMKRGGAERIVRQWTSLRQVFQIWSGHPEFSRRDQDIVSQIHQELEKSKRQVKGMSLVIKDIENISGMKASPERQAV